MEWISVKDRLPDEGTGDTPPNYVLVACNDRGVPDLYIAYLYKGNWDFEEWCPDGIKGNGPTQGHNITHWMPLPSPPDPSS